MWTFRKQGSSQTTKQRGDAAEEAALAHLQRHGLRLVQRNFKSPGRGGGEVDLIMRAPDGTLVFVEVRQRSGSSRGGAAASITALKQRRVIFAARHFLHRHGIEPPCRFDVVLLDTGMTAEDTPQIEWLQGAFDASATY